MTFPTTGANLLSFVIPVYNERDSLLHLYQEIGSACQSLGRAAEIIFIDDGSNDGSWGVICQIQAGDSRVAAIRLRRNFGKAAALSAGFAVARGEYIFSLDADLQDDPAEIGKMLAKIEEGYDLVTGWKQVRLDPWTKRFPSKVFNLLVGAVTGVWLHDHNCGFKLYRKQVVDEINLYGEFHRFTTVLADAKGFRVVETPVNHRARRFGKSKYGWRRFIRGFVDLLTIKFLTAYQSRPQHMLGSIGLLFFALGLTGLGWLSAEWLLTRMQIAIFPPIHERPLLIFSATGLLLGAQMLSIGLLAELITAQSHRERNHFSIAETRPASDSPASAGKG